MSDFTGHWHTTFGEMDLQGDGERIHGTYGARQECDIEGELENGRLVFTYREPAAAGEGWFEWLRHGKFRGRWREAGSDRWADWEGERGFEGVWETTFGRMRLLHHAGRVEGCYEALGGSLIEGVPEDSRLAFRYREPTVEGAGTFELGEDGQSFEGQWRPDGQEQWRPWVGRRLRPVPGHVWLIVLEAHWQRRLTDAEYSFGNMLREFFARVPRVQFAQRFFNNEAGLDQWCRDLRYIPEPVVLVIASHGTQEGLTVHGRTVSPLVLAEGLRYAENVRLLHFSSCLLLCRGDGLDLLAELQRRVPVPISGYTTSVNWAASAILEFTYLELILNQGLPAAAAAEQVHTLLAFAGDEAPAGAAFPAAGFRLLPAAAAGG
jgi:hypothetical protein